ncbi:MAG: hypothetical protein J0I99_00640 [Devosia sp.]|uniref:hypothetical protein n=1 Tax=Devosia sp. TaxID=1871048 RepID=UPI001AC878F3|nr:hypothetical protein [Devosia sp.]MBN9314224.1 hypothetical protein [Devosia sp.]
MKIASIGDFRRAAHHGPFAWPGGYPCYFVMADGEALSFEAAKDERRLILEALRDERDGNHPDQSWLPVALEINWEDTSLTCAHTQAPIPSAYGED